MRHARLWICGAALAFTVGLSHVATGQLASRPAEEWTKTLEGTDRVAGLKIEETIAALRLKPGDTVADIGAGSGVFEVPLAKAVSPGGKVYAVDIDKGFFDSIARKTSDAHVTNVQTVLGKFEDPNLPTKDVDLALFQDVLHHVQDRAGYLKTLSAYVKPSGRVAIIDYEGPTGPHPDRPELQVTKEQVGAWMASAGFKPTEEIKLFPTKWFVVYSRR